MTLTDPFATRIIAAEVSETGSYASLLEQGGAYDRMYQLQAQGYSETTPTSRTAGQSI